MRKGITRFQQLSFRGSDFSPDYVSGEMLFSGRCMKKSITKIQQLSFRGSDFFSDNVSQEVLFFE